MGESSLKNREIGKSFFGEKGKKNSPAINFAPKFFLGLGLFIYFKGYFMFICIRKRILRESLTKGLACGFQPSFNPQSMKLIVGTPIWVRLPNLSLHF